MPNYNNLYVTKYLLHIAKLFGSFNIYTENIKTRHIIKNSNDAL